MEENTTILQVCALNAGGIETFVMNVYRELDKDKIKFDFINYFDSEKEQFHEKEVTQYGSKIYKTGSMNCNNVFTRHYKKIKSLYKFLKKNNYTTIHIHASDSISLEDAIVAKIAKVPRIIVHSHNTSIGKSSSLYYLKKSFHNIIKHLWGYVATDYFACSELAAKWMFSKKLIDSKKVQIINNAINLKQYQFNKEVSNQLRHSLNIENNFVVGHIGRMSYQKNHDFLINIFKDIKNNYENSILLLIGNGELEDEIRVKVGKLGLEDSVIFYGLTNKVSELMQAMDVFVLPSHYEGLPLVGIEAQASGLKVITSDIVSSQMKITENVKYLSLEQTSKEWANEICLYINGYERRNMSNDIKNNGYDIKDVAKNLENFYLNMKGKN